MSVPASLRARDLDPLWEGIRDRLDAEGLAHRGRLRVPALPPPARLALQTLLARRPGATVALGELEEALVRLGVGEDLPAALAALGHRPSGERAARRSQRAAHRHAREAARAEVAAWPEPWAPQWIDAVIRAGVLRGFETREALTLIRQVRLVLDRLDPSCGTRLSRVDLAAQLLGSAHALDSGTRLEAAVARALRLQAGPAGSRELWEQVGVHLDLTSAPVLTWGLDLTDDCGLAPLARAALQASVPLHLSRFALEQHPAAVARSATVLVVENPRVVEAAAQARLSIPVVSTGGQPSSTVLLLLEQLLRAGAEIRYHGDFDAAGLAICERMNKLGLTPWRMNASDYLDALAVADAAGASLPVEVQAPGSTSWDPDLHHVFAESRRIVHQERLLPGLLEAALVALSG